jgi:hypothetical protein
MAVRYLAAVQYHQHIELCTVSLARARGASRRYCWKQLFEVASIDRVGILCGTLRLLVLNLRRFIVVDPRIPLIDVVVPYELPPCPYRERPLQTGSG